MQVRVDLGVLYSHLQHHNDPIIKQTQGQRRKKTSLQLYSPLTLLQGFERVVQGLHVRGCWRPNINFIFWPHCYDRHVEFFLFSWCWGQLHRGFSERSPRSGVAFPTTSGLMLSGILLAAALAPQTQLNYIIIQRPRDHLLDLWNRMFNRHQAEITVMQFRGYSLPVHHCSGTMGPSPCPVS